MKNVLLLLLFLLPGIVWSQVDIKINKKNVYVNEVVEIEVTVPGNDTQAPAKLYVDDLTFQILDSRIGKKFTFNSLTNESIDSVSYKIELILLEPGVTKISCNIDNNSSEKLILNVIDSGIDSNKEFPQLISTVSSNKLFINEKGYVKNTLYSLEYIPTVPYVRPLLELEANILDTPSIQDIYINNMKGKYRVTSAYSFGSNKAGTYIIPESFITYLNKEYIIPSMEIEVIPLPIETPQNTIVGKTLYIKRENIQEEYKVRSVVDFYIVFEGNSNLSNLTTLRDYYNVPAFLTETIDVRREYINDGEMWHYLKFRYIGTSTSLIGLDLDKISVPFFNTKNEELSLIIVDKIKVSGSVSEYLFYIVLFLAVVVTVGLIIISMKLLKKKNKDTKFDITDPNMGFDFSKRESEIFIILINGKSTKEIAEELCISPETVKKHIQNILKKTGAKSRLELLALVNSLK